MVSIVSHNSKVTAAETNKPTFTVVDITPEMAKAFLEKNHPNQRTINKTHVRSLVADMRSGAWVTNGDSIRFDEEGYLIDGQKRLTAAVEAGITLKDTMIVHNLPAESFKTIDQGQSRNTRQVLNMSGIDASAFEVTLTRALGWGPNDCSYKRYTQDQLTNLYLEHREAIRFAARPYSAKASEAIFSAPVRVVVAKAYICGADKEALAAFLTAFDCLYPTYEPDKNATTLAKFVMNARDKKRETLEDLYRKTQSAVQAYLKGQVLQTLKGVKEDLYKIPGLPQ